MGRLEMKDSSVDDSNFLDRPFRENLDAGLGDMDHFFDAHALTFVVAFLGLDSETHILFNHHRMVE